MCGICGIYGEANEPVVADMLDAIRHRGPDSFEVAVRGRHSLGAARLALISKHRGNQPNSLQPDIERSRGAERPCTVLLNGEIYNYRELQADLCDVLGSDASEVEVIGALYRRHGIEAIPMFRGMFALAILDGDRLVLARDRFGIKPLFFCRAGKAVLFASEIKALLRHPAVTPNLSLRALQETAVFGFICSPTLTPFEGVEQVSPGTILTVEPTRITRRTYYRVPPCRNEDETCTPYSQAVARLSAILQQSVESLMLHGEDRKGLYLSGGLDSSLVALLASRVGQQPLLTFTLYDSEGSPDLEVARRVAHAIGSQHFEFKVDLEDYLRELPDFVHHYENFIAGGVFDVHGGVAFHLLSRRVAEHVRVAFSGEGADELFGGYYWSYLHPLGLADRIRERAKSFGVEDDLGELISEVFPCPEDERTYQLNVFDLLMKSGLANYHLWSVDRSGSAFGFEIRPPYLTYELADFALSLPVEYKVGHQETKRILRAAAAPLFEEYGISPILSRPKVGMPAAIELVGRQVDDFATRLLYSSEGRHLGAARLVAMGHPFARFLRNPLEVILFDLFYRIFIEHRGRLPAGVGVRDFYS